MNTFTLTDEIHEKLDALMQTGYMESINGNPLAAADIWINLWQKIKETMDRYDMSYIEDLDDVFHGEQNIFNWSRDF